MSVFFALAFVLLLIVADAFRGISSPRELVSKSTRKVGRSHLRMGGDDFPVSMKWIQVGSVDDFPLGEITSINAYKDESIAVVRDFDGKFTAIVDKSPYLGVPLSYGAVKETSDGVPCIECPQSKTLFSLQTGEVVGDWIPFPPVINNILRIVVGPANKVIKYPLRNKGNKVQIEVDVNVKDRFESQYWRGLLDAQGKTDGSYF